MKERILKRFNEEIAALERELKVELPKEIQRARELGDLRENAEYKAAKDRQDIVNARIYQGIHFRFADVVARRQGKHVADWAFSHFLRPLSQ